MMVDKIGNRIRAERKARGLSIKELAEKCGVSTMTLQRIETGKTSPSVAILSQIAQYLLQPIGFFIREESPKIRIVKKDDHQVVTADNIQLTVIAPLGFLADNLFVNVVEAKKGRFVDSHTDDGYSFAYILEGGIIFEHDGVEYKLQQGDVLYYNASYPHSVTAVGKTHKSINIFFKGKK
jgi:transcriptional regulator with XRE-family HTH domain